MQALILAAGMGKRLGDYTKNNTKCMVPVNGTPLIDRVLKQLSELALNRVVIVAGYEGKKLMDYLGEEKNGLKIEYVNNPVYDKTNNIYSLALAKDKLMEDDTLLIESDLIFDDGMFKLLLANPFPNLALVAKYESWMDGTMVRIDEDNNIVNFVPKAAFRYEDTDLYYKTVNIYKFSKEFSQTKYVPFLDAYTKAVGNNEYYENVLRIISFLNSHDLKALPITNEKWYEIDDKQDLDIAEALFADEKDVLRKYYGRYGGFWRFPKMLDYCYLVNPYFNESRIIDEMEAFFRTLISEYPSGMKVNSLIASKCWGVKEEYVIPGNGAAELIKALMETLPGTLGVTRPTFEEYPNRLMPEQIVTYTPQRPDFRYTADDLMAYFEDKNIWSLVLINPDNPTGNYIPYEDCLRLAKWCQEREIVLVIDESFIDFSSEHPTFLKNAVLSQNDHMVVVKSISKSYGVPGLRLGVLATSNQSLMMNLRREMSIWNINSFGEFFLQILGKYEKAYAQAMDAFREERSHFVRALENIPYLRVLPSEANYVLCEVNERFTPRELAVRLLREYGILIKDCSQKCKGNYIRLAVRDTEDNNRLIEALKVL